MRKRKRELFIEEESLVGVTRRRIGKLVFAKAVSISASLTFKISKRHLRFVPKLLDLP